MKRLFLWFASLLIALPAVAQSPDEVLAKINAIKRDTSYLYGIGADVAEHRRYLCGDDRNGNGMHILHAQGVLDRNRGDGAGCVTPGGRDGLDVGLNAGAASGVAARDGKYS